MSVTTSRKIDVVVQRDLAGEIPLILDRDGNAIRCNETERRIARIMAGLSRVRGARFTRAELDDESLDAAIGAIHDAPYLRFLRETSATLAEGEMVLHDHPHIPDGVGPDTPVVRGIYATARESARTAIAAARLIGSGSSISYALGRPPGHHAGPAWLGGHCYLNNGALALMTLLRSGMKRAALIDFDIHFGNGSAAILERIPGAFFGSIHSSTITSYPYVPTSPLNGTQIYLPFDAPPSPEEFLDAVRLALRHALDAACEAIVISAGYDIIDGDPHGTWSLRPDVLRHAGTLFAGTGLPLCIVQEGGYLLPVLEECAYEFGMGLLGECAPRTIRSEREAVDIE